MKLFKTLIYPVLVFGALASFYSILPRVTEDQLSLWIATANFPFLVSVVLLERFLPFRTAWNVNAGDLATDAIHSLVIFPVAIDLLRKLFLQFFPPLLSQIWVHEAHVLLQLALLLLISEFFYYWYHRLSHEKGALWKLHIIHHGAQRVYWLNSARFHIIDLVASLAIYFIPGALFGVSVQVFGLFVALNAITGLLEHANIDFRAGWLNYLFNTAELHRWHHSEKLEISQKNYGKVLSIWDWILGTGHLPNEMNEAVGVEGEKVPENFLGQLKYPFYSSEKTNAN